VLDADGSNIDAFLSRDTCGSSTQLDRPIWSKQRISQPSNNKLQEVLLSKI
jgi:hypothetical protein